MNVSLDHYSRTVSNIEEVSAFFIKYFGFKTTVCRNDVTEKYLDKILNVQDACLTMRFLEGCGVTIELFKFTNPSGSRLDMCTINPGSTHLCFKVDDIFALYEQMKEDGIRFISACPVFIDKGGHAGGYSLYLLDPDDTVIELIQSPY